MTRILSGSLALAFVLTNIASPGLAAAEARPAPPPDKAPPARPRPSPAATQTHPKPTPHPPPQPRRDETVTEADPVSRARRLGARTGWQARRGRARALSAVGRPL